MQWTDFGIVLNQKPYSESFAIVSIFTENNGKFLGLMRNSNSKKSTNSLAQFQPGSIVQATWKARLPEHLGNWQLEMETPVWPLLAGGKFTDYKSRLAALSCVCSLLDQTLPERHPYDDLYQGIKKFMANDLLKENWLPEYIKFELNLLSNLGFGLNLDYCTVTKTRDNLAYVSPKSGSAVCKDVGAPYADKLLILPSFIAKAPQEEDSTLPPTCHHQTQIPSQIPSKSDLISALHLTGYFLYNFVLEEKPLPLLRQTLV